MSFDGRDTITTKDDGVFVRKVHNHGVAGACNLCLQNRQKFIRSYAFKKRETVPQKAKNCIVKVKGRVALRWKSDSRVRRRYRCWGLKRAAKATAFYSRAVSFFRRVLSCPAKGA